MALKRSREEEGDFKALTMKLKGLKRSKEDVDFSKISRLLLRMEKPAARTFKCKTCDREFDSFQALGGHRASHSAKSDDPLKNQKRHVCKECGADFAKGQALGGHMRKHRGPSPTTSEEMSSDLMPRVDVAVSNVLDPKEISSSKRVRSSDIDLNLVPSEESENYDVDENNSKLNHGEESDQEEDHLKSLEEENYPTENYSKLKNYELDENNSKLKHDDLPLEEEKLNNEWKYKKINLETLALQERDLNIKYYYFLDE